MIIALQNAYYAQQPDVVHSAELVSFGTSGHRGSSLKTSFNEHHVLAIAQAVVDYRNLQGYTGPLYLGRDTHALSQLAWQSTLQVLVANGVQVCIDSGELAITATPVISHTILHHNAEHPDQLADGLVITPSHNPPEDGGIKYNPHHGGPADAKATDWIQQQANRYLQAGLEGIQQIAFDDALKAAQLFDYTSLYLNHLEQVIDLDAIRQANLTLGVDPLGGAGLPIWLALEAKTGIKVEVVNQVIDSSFAFMPTDHDGKIRMDCSSPFAMENLLAIKDRFDLAFGNDPDADRHGIVDHRGLMSPNAFLAVCIDYLLSHRPEWSKTLKIGKTLVSSSLIDRVVAAHQRELFETPVGLKWFVDGLQQGWLAFGGEESAGATLLTRDGRPWSTDKDGIALCLLAAEIMAVTGKSPSEYYLELTRKHGNPAYRRVDTPLTPDQKAGFKRLNAQSIDSDSLAGEPIQQVYVNAPGNQASIGGIKVVTANGWFAARPSGTEPLYKIYAESFKGELHLNELIEEAKSLLAEVL